MTKFMDSISLDVKNEYIKVNFLTPYELKIKTDAIFEEIPLFKNIYTPRSNKWSERVSEEIDIFDILKEKYGQSLGFLVFNNLNYQNNNTRIWEVDFYMTKNSKPTELKINLPLRYPFQMPIVEKSTGDYHVSSYKKCFGMLSMRWRRDGKFGLAHFCVMIGYYYALEKMSKRIQ